MHTKNVWSFFSGKVLFFLFCIFAFSFLNIFNEGVLGQEESEDLEWPTVRRVKELETYETNILEEKDNLLFVSADCEGCLNLFSDLEKMEIQSFDIYFFDISANTETRNLLEYVYTQCEDLETGVGTPFFFSDGSCYAGYVSIRDKVTAMIVAEKEGFGSYEDFDFLESYKSYLERQEFLGKSLSDIVTEDTVWWEWALLGLLLVLGVAFLIYWVLNRRSVGKKQRVIFTLLQTFLFLLPTAYLGFKVNTAINLGNEYSSAEEGNCADTNTCATYADLMEARASGGGAQTTEEQKRHAEKYIEANGGSGSAEYESVKSTQKTQVVASSQAIMKEVGTTSGGEVDWEKAKKYKSVLTSTTSSTGAVSVSGNKVTITSDSGSIIVDASAAYAINPTAVYIAQVNSVGITCSDLASCEKALYNQNQANLGNPDATGTEGVDETYVYQIDTVSGQLVKTPVSMANIDDFCTVKDPAVSGGKDDKKLCYCENGLGGGVYTRVFNDVSCDAVCRTRNLVCEDCSPETYVNTVEPPPGGGPYCGDGILGNTVGEECEYNDPSGVKCSWNACSSTCTCPTDPAPYCGDGKVDIGEQCELGDPAATQCTWDNCNKTNCLCVKPGCGDGNLDEGETCERNDPDGASCLWEECNQLICSCKVTPSPTCGDGILQEGELCESGNPTGSQCDWAVCSKSTCVCPTSPHTAIFDESYKNKILYGVALILLGLLFHPLVSLINSSYFVISNGVIKIGRHVNKVEKDIKKKKDEKTVKGRREKIERRFK